MNAAPENGSESLEAVPTRKAGPKRSRPRKFLIAIIVAVVSGAGYFAWEDISIRRRVANLQSAGGTVHIDVLPPDWLLTVKGRLGLDGYLNSIGSKVSTINVAYMEIGDQSFQEFLKLPNVYAVEANFTNITDASMEALSQCKSASFLRLSGNKISDAGARHLLSLPKLSFVDLAGTDVTDQTLEELLKLPLLHKVCVGGEKIRSLKVTSFKVSPPKKGDAYDVGEVVTVEGSFVYPNHKSPLIGIVVTSGTPGRSSPINHGGRNMVQDGDRYTFKRSLAIHDEPEAHPWTELTVTTETDVRPKVMYELGRIRISIRRGE